MFLTKSFTKSKSITIHRIINVRQLGNINAFDPTFNVLVILANISQSEGDWQSAMQFCGSPFGSRNSLNTSSDISVNVSSSGEVNQSSWIAAYALYTPWIKMLGVYVFHC